MFVYKNEHPSNDRVSFVRWEQSGERYRQAFRGDQPVPSKPRRHTTLSVHAGFTFVLRNVGGEPPPVGNPAAIIIQDRPKREPRLCVRVPFGDIRNRPDPTGLENKGIIQASLYSGSSGRTQFVRFVRRSLEKGVHCTYSAREGGQLVIFLGIYERRHHG